MKKDKHHDTDESTENEVKSSENGHSEHNKGDGKESEDSQNKIKELEDKYIRLYADFENFRKRSISERRDILLQGNKELINNILPVFDDFERGLANMESAQDKESIIEGFKLIYQKFRNTLSQAGVEPLDDVAKPFDPELHDAVVTIPAPSDDLKGKVVDVIQKGYKLHDKILRHSKVVVGE